MAKESAGEWKLLKVWQCKTCRSLIKDGREVFEHTCNIKEREEELSRLRKIIEELNHTVDEKDIVIKNQKTLIEGRDRTIENQNSKIAGLENFIEELNSSIIEKGIEIKNKEQIIDELKTNIIDKEKVITDLNKRQSKVVEKIIYLDKNVPKSESDEEGRIENINVDIYQKNDRIKDSKDEGYREEIEVEIFERGKGREKIIVKNGKVIKKPEDIILIGKNSSEGFVVKGIYRN